MSRIIAAQIDTISGDVEYNSRKIADCIKKAAAGGAGGAGRTGRAAGAADADLVIFPAYTFTGFPFGNILSRNKSVLMKQNEALHEAARTAEGIAVILCTAEPVSEAEGLQMLKQVQHDNFYNSPVLIKNGQIIKNIDFFELNGIKYGIIPLEDETAAGFEAAVSDVMRKKPDVLIQCACSPSRCGREYARNKILSSIAQKYGVKYIFANKAGYSDNFVFEGASRIYDKTGKITMLAQTFKEDFAAADDFKGAVNALSSGMEAEFSVNDFKLNYKNDLERTYKSIIYSIRQYFSKNGFSKAVLGLSGGLDSSVCAVLLSDALGKENVYGISMPGRITSKESRTDAEILAENLGINFFEAPLISGLNEVQNILDKVFENTNAEKYTPSVSAENLQARLRAVILWNTANEHKGMLPIATSDKSEAYIGYATVNGDMSGGFAPIADVPKTKLFMLADYLNKMEIHKNAIPQSVLEKPPGAELKINPKTGKPVYAEEDNMPYEFLDEIIHLIENTAAGAEELLNHKFLYEAEHSMDTLQKSEWINKFFLKSRRAVYKWHILPESVIIDRHSINSAEFRSPVIHKI